MLGQVSKSLRRICLDGLQPFSQRFSQACLRLMLVVLILDQAFVKNPDMKVRQFVESKGGTLKGFVRYAVGEGIEKREDNFAEEEMNQVKGSN